GSNIVTGLYPQRLDIRAMIAFTLLWRFIAMKLQQIQRHGVQRLIELAGTGIDEQPDGTDKRRQCGDDRPRLLHSHRARTLGIKHQTNSISPGFDGSQSVFYAGNAADLAANG